MKFPIGALIERTNNKYIVSAYTERGEMFAKRAKQIAYNLYAPTEISGVYDPSGGEAFNAVVDTKQLEYRKKFFIREEHWNKLSKEVKINLSKDGDWIHDRAEYERLRINNLQQKQERS